MTLERLITIVSHNAPDTPAKFLLMKPMTYQELSEALSTRESSPVTTLVFVPIPYPHYRLPREGELISPWTRSTFTIPLQEGLMLTVVRTLTGDKTKVFKYSELNRSSGTMEEILSPLLRRDTLVIRSIQACSTGSDIRSNIFSIQDLKSINTFPTIAFIDTIDDYPKFLTRISSTASRPIKVLGTFAEKLIEKASISDVAPLQKIHIARGAFHLIASAAGAKQTTGLNEEQLADILELEGLLSDIEECIGLDQYDAAKDAIERLFYQLCEDRPGAFEVRCSYDKFVEFKYIDGGAASQFALKAHELEEPPSMGLSQLFECAIIIY
ncbi:hypothetical protein FRC17_008552 [Serendipita sp. 399]|nr:hypothetical protein FRC17_008552 [Serendipita sp. 399]